MNSVPAAAWAVSLASGPEAYAMFKGLMGSWFGLFVMFGLTLCLFYHLANGIQTFAMGQGLVASAGALRRGPVFRALATAMKHARARPRGDYDWRVGPDSSGG